MAMVPTRPSHAGSGRGGRVPFRKAAHARKRSRVMVASSNRRASEASAARRRRQRGGGRRQTLSHHASGRPPRPAVALSKRRRTWHERAADRERDAGYAAQVWPEAAEGAPPMPPNESCPGDGLEGPTTGMVRGHDPFPAQASPSQPPSSPRLLSPRHALAALRSGHPSPTTCGARIRAWRALATIRQPAMAPATVTDGDGIVRPRQWLRAPQTLNHWRALPDWLCRAGIALRVCFGHAWFRPGQLAAIQGLWAGRSQLVVLPTGHGKSLCYLLPAALATLGWWRPHGPLPSPPPPPNRVCGGLVLVVSPLTALMADQAAQLPQSLSGVALHHRVPDLVLRAGLAALAAGEATLAWVSPERLAAPAFLAWLRATWCAPSPEPTGFGAVASLVMVCLDEIHCVDEWSHTFRPAFLTALTALHTLLAPSPTHRPVPLLGLSATVSPQGRQRLVQRILAIVNPTKPFSLQLEAEEKGATVGYDDGGGGGGGRGGEGALSSNSQQGPTPPEDPPEPTPDKLSMDLTQPATPVLHQQYMARGIPAAVCGVTVAAPWPARLLPSATLVSPVRDGSSGGGGNSAMGPVIGLLADPRSPFHRIVVAPWSSDHDEAGQVLVYVRTRAEAASGALLLAHSSAVPWLTAGSVCAYHAGLSPEVRALTESRTRRPRSPLRVVVATIAYGLGIDNPNVRGVIITYLAALPSLVQLGGRAGRDGRRPAWVHVCFDLARLPRALGFHLAAFPDRAALLRFVLHWCAPRWSGHESVDWVVRGLPGAPQRAGWRLIPKEPATAACDLTPALVEALLNALPDPNPPPPTRQLGPHSRFLGTSFLGVWIRLRPHPPCQLRSERTNRPYSGPSGSPTQNHCAPATALETRIRTLLRSPRPGRGGPGPARWPREHGPPHHRLVFLADLAQPSPQAGESTEIPRQIPTLHQIHADIATIVHQGRLQAVWHIPCWVVAWTWPSSPPSPPSELAASSPTLPCPFDPGFAYTLAQSLHARAAHLAIFGAKALIDAYNILYPLALPSVKSYLRALSGGPAPTAAASPLPHAGPTSTRPLKLRLTPRKCVPWQAQQIRTAINTYYLEGPTTSPTTQAPHNMGDVAFDTPFGHRLTLATHSPPGASPNPEAAWLELFVSRVPTPAMPTTKGPGCIPVVEAQVSAKMVQQFRSILGTRTSNTILLPPYVEFIAASSGTEAGTSPTQAALDSHQAALSTPSAAPWTPMALARILAGISSPRYPTHTWEHHPSWGRWRHVPLSELLLRAHSFLSTPTTPPERGLEG